MSHCEARRRKDGDGGGELNGARDMSGCAVEGTGHFTGAIACSGRKRNEIVPELLKLEGFPQRLR